MKFLSTFLLTIMFTATSMGGTPPLPNPEELVGDWVLSDGRRLCNLHLGIEEVPQANGFKLALDPQSGACQLFVDAVAWRVASDGISLLDHEGTTLIFFSRDAQDYRSDIAGDSGMCLRRKSAAD